MPEQDKTVAELNEMFSRLAKQDIGWQVKSLFYPGRHADILVEVGGFDIHPPEGDFTAAVLLASLKEGYDRVQRYREQMRQTPPKLNKPRI